MADEWFQYAATYGVHIDLLFTEQRPVLGDLFLISGRKHPAYPPGGGLNFAALAELGFEQADDYWAVSEGEGGAGSVTIWLSPLVGDQEVYHHEGPFDGLRLAYSILRNPDSAKKRLFTIVKTFARELPVQVVYRTRNLDLGAPPDLTVLAADIEQVVAYWRSQGVEPGSDAALQITF